MENQDKLYEQFKNAAGKAEGKSFDRMEAVWNRVEEKLDEKKKRRILPYWKYAGVAAILLLCLTIGGYIFNNPDNPVTAPNVLPEKNVVIDREKVEQVMNPNVKENSRKEEVVVNEKFKKPENDSIRFSTSSKKAIVWKDGRLSVSEPDNSTATTKQPKANLTINTKRESNSNNHYKGITTVNEEVAKHAPPAGTDAISFVPQEKVSVGINYTIDKSAVETYLESPSKKYGSNKDIVLGGKKLVYENRTGVGEFRAQSEITKKEKTATELLKEKGVNIIPGEAVALQSDKTIRIRGMGSITGEKQPLYVVDDVIYRDDISKINSQDISSMTFLKDGEAAVLYGSRGANGVIIIKTNKELSKREKRRLQRLDEKLEKNKQAIKINVDKTEEEYESFTENPFENPATTPLSTFSIDVDNASYTNVRRFLNNGQTVPKDAVRVEEMINFFKYQYTQPKDGTPFSMHTEYSAAPWNPQHKLLKIGLQGKDIPTESLPASNLVFLIDVSGSMKDANKLPLLKQSMKLLINQMRKQDRVAIVVYAAAAGLVLPSTDGDEKDKIIAALDNLSSGGSTAGGEGIELAYKTAQENFIKNGNNRVVLATDGDFNVGASSDKDMQTLIEEKRKSGVFLTCLGYGMGNYKDAKMEVLADKGNGNYAYIDNMQEADRFLQKEFKGSMYAIAKDVKIQIEFNPKHVQSYRLIGYENRKLRDEDFANDAIDAGELGSGHTVTALYEIIPVGVKSAFFNGSTQLKYSTPETATGNYTDELATIKFRYKKPDEDKSNELVKIIQNVTVPLQLATPDFKFAASVAWFGLKLRDSKLLPNKKREAIKALAKERLVNDPEGYRAEFIRLVDMVD